MDVLELFQRLGLALAIGFLVGVERGWRERGEAEGARTAGLRTFALTGLLGGISGLVGQAVGGLAFGAAFLAFSSIFTAFKWREARHDNDYSVTAIVAAMVVFMLGAYSVLGEMRVAAAAGVTAVALLAFKSVLHAWLRRLTWPEIRSAIVLAAMTFVALPILPDKGYGPYSAINPYEIWLMAVLIAGVSFAGYVFIRVAGERLGVLIAGAAGGLVASTAATLDLARRSAAGGHAGVLAGGAAVAGGVMFLRVLAVATVVDPDLFGALSVPLGGAAVTSGGLGLALAMAGRDKQSDRGAPHLGNPFDLVVVFRFAALLGAVMLAASMLRAWFGPESAVWLAAAAGLADVDAVTLSMARLAGGDVPSSTAVTAIVVVAMSNSLSKAAIGGIAGSFAFAVRFGAVMVAAVMVAAALVWLLPIDPGVELP
ncbi:MgtC/SapB family protein [Microbaculum marinum]|uniref:DUF4010 domain-containing protein n=1 Tax=Microbaculum marinum TaxID=1764581 RepID=A0AAW9S3I7_9HYPH